eukprot:TRINITY_DN9792_c0_g1_i2.p1 TRINITY_DN9792_c0_g1~~TRINITY_DN9792_c0_g1_i2.p1  ORF type:complete len:753 (-),score=145.01 TRINITY_DN9792_c0_g1_i2:56-2314(-)
MRYSFVVDQSIGPGKFWHTMIVRVSPAFFMVNSTNQTIHYALGTNRQEGKIDRRSKIPFHFPKETSKDNFDLSVGCTYGLSVPLSLMKRGFFQVGFSADRLQSTAYLNVEIALHGEITNVVISEPEKALYKFKNDTQYTVHISASSGVVDSYKTVDWFWLSPQSEHNIQFNFALENWESDSIKLDFLKLAKTKRCKGKDKEDISITVVGEGFTKCVHCFVVTDESESDTCMIQFFTLSMRINKLEISVINDLAIEMFNVVMSTINLLLSAGHNEESLRVTVQAFQVDNQLPNSDSVTLYLQPGNKDHVINLRAISDISSSLQSFKLLKLDILPIYVSVDLDLLFHLLHYVFWLLEVVGDEQNEETQKLLEGEVPDFFSFLEKDSNSVILYFQNFHISSLKIGFTFRNTHNITEKEQENLNTKAFYTWFDISQYAKLSVEGVSLSVKQMEKRHLFSTPDQFGEILQKEYQRQVLFQIGKILAGQLASLVTGKSESPALRIRPARYIDQSGVLLPFEEVKMQSMLNFIENGKYRFHKFILFSEVVYNHTLNNNQFILVTDQSLLLLFSKAQSQQQDQQHDSDKEKEMSLHQEIRLYTLHPSLGKTTNILEMSYYKESEVSWNLFSLQLKFPNQATVEQFHSLLLPAATTNLSFRTVIGVPRGGPVTKSAELIYYEKHSKGPLKINHVCKIHNGILSFKNLNFVLSESHVKIDVDHPGRWFLVKSKGEVEGFKCKNLREAASWVEACVMAGASQI